MATENRAARGMGRLLVIIFIILILGIASFGAYIKWGGAGIQQWARTIPVVSSLVGEQEIAGPTEQKGAKLEQYIKRVNEQSEEIANLEQSLNGKEQQVDRLQDQIAALQQRLDEQKSGQTKETAARNQNVAKVYAEMPPGSAAAILNQLENSEAIRILSQLKPETAALIMAKMDKEKVAKLTVSWAGSGE